MQNCIDIHVHETIRTSRYVNVSNVYALLLKMNRYCDINYDGRCGLHLHPPLPNILIKKRDIRIVRYILPVLDRKDKTGRYGR